MAKTELRKKDKQPTAKTKFSILLSILKHGGKLFGAMFIMALIGSVTCMGVIMMLASSNIIGTIIGSLFILTSFELYFILRQQI